MTDSTTFLNKSHDLQRPISNKKKGAALPIRFSKLKLYSGVNLLTLVGVLLRLGFYEAQTHKTLDRYARSLSSNKQQLIIQQKQIQQLKETVTQLENFLTTNPAFHEKPSEPSPDQS